MRMAVGLIDYLWNMTHCATVTIPSCVSLRAESFAFTASSVYAMIGAVLV